MMVACVALVAVGVSFAAAGFGWAFLLFVIPCVLMMGAMAWMMTRGPSA